MPFQFLSDGSLQIPANLGEKLGGVPTSTGQAGGGKGSPRASPPRRDTAGDDARVEVAAGPVQFPYVRLGLVHTRQKAVGALEHRVATHALPAPRSRLVEPSRGLPEALVIACPGEAAGCCRPGCGCWGSIPQPGTAAAGARGIQRFVLASFCFRSENQNLELHGCAEH